MSENWICGLLKKYGRGHQKCVKAKRMSQNNYQKSSPGINPTKLFDSSKLSIE
jgi:hypothetical protein